MKILHISDTHGKHRLLKNLPPADIIVHSGDMSEDGAETGSHNGVKQNNAIDWLINK